MQEANGDWFAIKESMRLRVPLFTSQKDAMAARSFNVEMLVFKPVPIDERALKQFEHPHEKRPVCFWLVEEASRNMRRGVALDHEQIALILSGAADAAAGQGTNRE